MTFRKSVNSCNFHSIVVKIDTVILLSDNKHVKVEPFAYIVLRWTAITDKKLTAT